MLAGAAVPFSCSFSAAFPLGGVSIIILENPDAFGVFECPNLYWAKILFNFVPCNLVMILLKRLWAFVHSYLQCDYSNRGTLNKINQSQC